MPAILRDHTPAWFLHQPGALLGRPPSAALLGPSAPALTLNMASISPIRIRQVTVRREGGVEQNCY
ncbi:hypothetical protein JRI60_35885 [Archangium violaceum]|uniref:hypothetical protein n=1 Tax=Archangium violaceum TaxID=83451 RepID=UPI001951C54F|nr:hypothetical protein [Archangium violaceum]QRO03071.1 hypothetical protein JRI60_35885 [Archangium violaceum]